MLKSNKKKKIAIKTVKKKKKISKNNLTQNR